MNEFLHVGGSWDGQVLHVATDSKGEAYEVYQRTENKVIQRPTFSEAMKPEMVMFQKETYRTMLFCGNSNEPRMTVYALEGIKPGEVLQRLIAGYRGPQWLFAEVVQMLTDANAMLEDSYTRGGIVPDVYQDRRQAMVKKLRAKFFPGNAGPITREHVTLEQINAL